MNESPMSALFVLRRLAIQHSNYNQTCLQQQSLQPVLILPLQAKWSALEKVQAQRMETKQAVLPLSAPVSTSILLCFGNRHNHITVFDKTIFVSSMTLYQQAVRPSIQTLILRCKILVGNTQTLELHPVDAGCFKQTKRKTVLLLAEFSIQPLCQS